MWHTLVKYLLFNYQSVGSDIVGAEQQGHRHCGHRLHELMSLPVISKNLAALPSSLPGLCAAREEGAAEVNQDG